MSQVEAPKSLKNYRLRAPGHHAGSPKVADTVIAAALGRFISPGPTASVFSCAGFEPPMSNRAVKVKKNRVLPLKAQLFENSTPITAADITGSEY